MAYYATLMSMHTPPTNVCATPTVDGLPQCDDASAQSSFGDVVAVESCFSTSNRFSLSLLLSDLGWSTGCCCCFRSTSHRHFFAGSRNDDTSSLSSSVSVAASARRWPDGESPIEGMRWQRGTSGDALGTGDETTGDGLGSATFSHLCSKHSAAVIRSLHSIHSPYCVS